MMVTLWPSFPHFDTFVHHRRISGIRLNSAMMSNPELDKELEKITSLPKDSRLPRTGTVPLLFDIKGRQPRIIEVLPNDENLELRLNHPITVKTPCPVLFKAGEDSALLDHLEEDGQRLVFRGGPHYRVKAGESLYLRDPSFQIRGDLFTPEEVTKMQKCVKAGFKSWFLSYVEEERDVELFLEHVGRDAEVYLKIESMKGLDFVNRFPALQKRHSGLSLVAARGDLYVEIDRPHNIAKALQHIIDHDMGAVVASRLLLSTSEGPVPSCADFLELQWLWEAGYHRYMLCDELCLREDKLSSALQAFDEFRSSLP